MIKPAIKGRLNLCVNEELPRMVIIETAWFARWQMDRLRIDIRDVWNDFVAKWCESDGRKFEVLFAEWNANDGNVEDDSKAYVLDCESNPTEDEPK